MQKSLRSYLLALGLFIPGVLGAQPAQPADSFNVFTYGATGNGNTLDTAAVQRTIDAAAAAGRGAQVEIPQGFSFLVGTLVLRSGIDFEVNGELIASTNRADYSGDGLLTASNAVDLQITGTGDLTGRSLSFMTNYDTPGERWLPAPWRPEMFLLTSCTNLTIRDLTFGDSPSWGLHLLGCSNVVVDDVTIRNRLNVPDSDGIDADHCRRVEISNCDVAAGGDAIAVKNTRQLNDFGPCANIYVHDCTVQAQASGLNIGPETVSDVHDVIFERCHIASAGRGIAIQLRDAGSVSNVIFRGLQFFAQYHADPWRGRGEGISLTAIPRTSETKPGTIENILIQNVSGRSENSLRINGAPAGHLRNVRLENVNITLDRWTKYAGGRYDNRPTETPDPVEKHVTSGFNLSYTDGLVLKDCAVHWGKNLPDYFTSALETDQVTGLELWGFKGLAARPGRFPDLIMH